MSGCLIYALRQWWPLRRKGAYLVIGMSEHGPVFHVMLARSAKGLEIEEYIPRRPRRGIWGFPWILYRGRVRRRVL